MARRSPEPAASPIRGAILVVVAIVVGFFLLSRGLDTSETIVADDTPTATTGDEPGDDGGTEGETDGQTDGTTPTTEPVRTPDQVRVVVLNDTDVDGAATTWSDGIQAFGYSMATAGNADLGLTASQVQYQNGYKPEAEALIASLGSPAGVTAQKVSTPPPGEIGNANLVFVLGPDLASSTPPSPGGGGGGSTGAG